MLEKIRHSERQIRKDYHSKNPGNLLIHTHTACCAGGMLIGEQRSVQTIMVTCVHIYLKHFKKCEGTHKRGYKQPKALISVS